jgi:amino acid transporter
MSRRITAKPPKPSRLNANRVFAAGSPPFSGSRARWAGYVAMTQHITNAGAFYAFIARGLGRPAGVAAALVALLAYTFLQVGLYGAFGPNAQEEAAAHLHLHAAWWAWALAAWAIVTALGLARVDVTGKVLGVLLSAEVIVIMAETG